MKKKNEEKKENKDQGLIKKNEELEHQVKRTLADYQNLEKRVAEDKIEWVKLANRQLLLRILPALDSLILAEKHTKDEGVILSIKTFLDAFGQEGIKKIETVGKDFDPNTMECVHVAEVDPSAGSGQGQGEGKVVEEIKAGYTLYDRILRPAQVIVGKQQ
ncbi:MAG: nucleotide exchange factor GrpE [Candidatus Levybacteria bacterium CG_4_9_14_3_um_filter_35_16]|nr:MAG: nucleotide exchange factor GrpE [Candidatus Levybacteria bacterium CG22_combo_CG10-13_8_21_14_all_35_11]PIY94421.1 MAG: nucleotide exchange factor GrpE [Candidatus Levybacteria bacterium CG_4_10_14_0_8_um_filter_35_23]PIZ99286.1 MAG: nucleotide exchange factor GrpE [Candidatus Levybacteria bacterium CG_4_10_14_0_2_um_filter_35_8]PJA91169.1 MAG: nucleotide exchange factor GrpE [Candidatus Levybacteria bacterium CG_4_9_14_3_um_filter_35_16]PJC54047.1 MAG: nucleotide exchange factor GrpE [